MLHTIESIASICSEVHGNGKSIILATGFFDLLHDEHVTFLKKAKNHGDVLIVAVESDERARELKGAGRPVEPQLLRCKKVSQYADFVICLGSDFNNFEAYDSLMSAIRPETYAVSEHTSHQKSKAFLVEKYGGKLEIVHDWNPLVSTTKILQTKNNV